MSYVIHSVEGNHQRLDGGAMFGNVPRMLWQKWIEPDEQHRIELACRAFLIHDTTTGRRILLEAGVGLFFEPKLQQRFGIDEPEHKLLVNLAALDVEPEDIDVVVLSHLHFDHLGGLLTSWKPDRTPELVFPRALHVASRRNWERAQAPHPRDRASFVPEALDLLQGSGRLELVDDPSADVLGRDFSFFFSDGHTPGMMLTRLATPTGSVAFCGDLVPGRPWIHLPVTMGYDRFPELIVEEKEKFLTRCLADATVLLFTHDAGCAACTVTRDQRGRYAAAGEMAAVSGLML
jgi:glyoxylase-like metal-dependent hydrolase (beta-lactamase superfamily II)